MVNNYGQSEAGAQAAGAVIRRWRAFARCSAPPRLPHTKLSMWKETHTGETFVTYGAAKVKSGPREQANARVVGSWATEAGGGGGGNSKRIVTLCAVPLEAYYVQGARELIVDESSTFEMEDEDNPIVREGFMDEEAGALFEMEGVFVSAAAPAAAAAEGA